MEHIHQNKVMYCQNLVGENPMITFQNHLKNRKIEQNPKIICNGPIKPAIKFFGEPVGNDFAEAWERIEDPTIDDATIDGTKDALMSMTKGMCDQIAQMKRELAAVPVTYEEYVQRREEAE